MKVKELINQLKNYEDYNFLVSCDEELNIIFEKVEINVLNEGSINEVKGKSIIIFGLSGSEVDN